MFKDGLTPVKLHILAERYVGDGWIYGQMTGQSLDMNMLGRAAVNPL